jgi:hypothetical protein
MYIMNAKSKRRSDSGNFGARITEFGVGLGRYEGLKFRGPGTLFARSQNLTKIMNYFCKGNHVDWVSSDGLRPGRTVHHGLEMAQTGERWGVVVRSLELGL